MLDSWKKQVFIYNLDSFFLSFFFDFGFCLFGRTKKRTSYAVFEIYSVYVKCTFLKGRAFGLLQDWIFMLIYCSWCVLLLFFVCFFNLWGLDQSHALILKVWWALTIFEVVTIWTSSKYKMWNWFIHVPVCVHQ